jgi:hypothetical protein
MTSMLEKVSRIHKTYLLDQQLFCWRHFSKTEVVQNTDLNILALYYIIMECFHLTIKGWGKKRVETAVKSTNHRLYLST